MAEHPRYRVEDGKSCIDVRLPRVEHLFDNRDPAPFRERDLDPALVEYLVAAAEDLLPHRPFQVVLWIGSRSGADDKLESAYRAHFAYELERLDRRRHRERRAGKVSLVFGLVVLVTFVLLAKVAARVPGIGSILKEGLTISSWVILWRPIQALAYDWWPMRRQRRVMVRLRDAPLIVREGEQEFLPGAAS